MKRILLGMILFLGCFILPAPQAMASSSGSSGLPYESALEKVKDSLSGSVATSLSVIGICLAGAMLNFGGDMNGFFRALCMVVLVCSLMVGGTKILSTLGISGATISSFETMQQEDSHE